MDTRVAPASSSGHFTGLELPREGLEVAPQSEQNRKLQALLGAETSTGYYGDLERKAGGGTQTALDTPGLSGASAQVSVGPRAFQIWPSTSLKMALT